MKKHATDTLLQVILVVVGLAFTGFLIYNTFTSVTHQGESELRSREGIEKIKAAQEELERVRQKNQENQ